MQLPDPRKSYAILFGTSTYDSPGLPDIPAVEANLGDLAAVLSHPKFGGFDRDRCKVLHQPMAPAAVARELSSIANDAEDTLLIYFAGHGLAGGHARDLFLAFHDTDPDLPGTSALRYDDLRQLLLETGRFRARNRIIILDCCYSGRAAAVMSPDSLLGLTDIEGVYVLTATAANRLASAPDGHRNSAFTAKLIELLRNGVDDGPPLLTMDLVYQYLVRVLAAGGYPRPWRSTSQSVGSLAIAHNPASFASTEKVARSRPTAPASRSNRWTMPPTSPPSTPMDPAPGPALETQPATSSTDKAPHTRSAAGKPIIKRREVLLVGAGVVLSAAGFAAYKVSNRPVILDHGSEVPDLAFHPSNGKIIATAAADGNVRVWNLDTPRSPRVLKGHSGAVVAVAFHPDGAMVASAGHDKTIRLWDTMAATTTTELKGHTDGVSDLTFSPDGKLLVSAGVDHTARLWNLATRTVIATIYGQRQGRAVFSPNGSSFYLPSDGLIKCYTAMNGTIVNQWQPFGFGVVDMAMDPWGYSLACASGGGECLIWSLRTPGQIGLFNMPDVANPRFAFHPDGNRLAVASGTWNHPTASNRLAIASVSEGQLLTDIHDHDKKVYRALFSSDGHRVASASEDHTVRVSESSAFGYW